MTATSELAETVMQFGSGRFLRAFADLFIHQANQGFNPVGKVVVIQSTGGDRAGWLNRQGGQYHVVLRGLENGAVVDRVEPCASISRALVAATQWDEVRSLARSPQLRLILSNTTEAGYSIDPADAATAYFVGSSATPRSFPAKLLAVLQERFDAGLSGPTIVPCELREHNADLLLGLVEELADGWRLPGGFRRWLQTECVWLNSLVDRIVTGTPREHPLLADDPMLTLCEPYALSAIQKKERAWQFLENPHVVWTSDVMPYFLRKVRILNGAHTALLVKAWPRGFRTVREAVNDLELGGWLERLLFEEVVPVLEGRVDGPHEFARQTLDRFRNPFIEHKLADIAVHHASKVQVRLVPTREEFREKFGRTPPLLDEVLKLPTPVV